MMSNKKQLMKLVAESANNTHDSMGRNTLTCAKAFKLAKEHDVMISEIGNICNQLNIKICNCQLGCFK